MSAPGHATGRSARGFDRLALVYDLMANLTLGGRIHASQVALLPRLPHVPRALVLGGGTGRFLTELLSDGRVDLAVSIDVSQEMTRRTAARLEGRGLTDRVELRVGGLECLDPGERFDLVVTHCFLDLFQDEELVLVVRALERALVPRGIWLFSDFSVAGPGAAGFARRSVVAVLYAFFRAACSISARRLPDFDRAFEGASLEVAADSRHACGLLRAALLRKGPGKNRPDAA